MDRDAYVRAARRRQVQDALAFERDREELLVETLEDVLADIGGPALDTDLFLQMSAEGVALVRRALGEELESEPDDDPELDDGGSADDLDLDDDETGDSRHDDVEEEIARLQAELASSRRVQAALGQYLELLSTPPAEV